MTHSCHGRPVAAAAAPPAAAKRASRKRKKPKQDYHGYDPSICVIEGDPRLQPPPAWFGVNYHPSQPISNSWLEWSGADMAMFDISCNKVMPISQESSMAQDTAELLRRRKQRKTHACAHAGSHDHPAAPASGPLSPTPPAVTAKTITLHPFQPTRNEWSDWNKPMDVEFEQPLPALSPQAEPAALASIHAAPLVLGGGIAGPSTPTHAIEAPSTAARAAMGSSPTSAAERPDGKPAAAPSAAGAIKVKHEKPPSPDAGQPLPLQLGMRGAANGHAVPTAEMPPATLAAGSPDAAPSHAQAPSGSAEHAAVVNGDGAAHSAGTAGESMAVKAREPSGPNPFQDIVLSGMAKKQFKVYTPDSKLAIRNKNLAKLNRMRKFMYRSAIEDQVAHLEELKGCLEKALKAGAAGPKVLSACESKLVDRALLGDSTDGPTGSHELCEHAKSAKERQAKIPAAKDGFDPELARRKLTEEIRNKMQSRRLKVMLNYSGEWRAKTASAVIAAVEEQVAELERTVVTQALLARLAGDLGASDGAGGRPGLESLVSSLRDAIGSLSEQQKAQLRAAFSVHDLQRTRATIAALRRAVAVTRRLLVLPQASTVNETLQSVLKPNQADKLLSLVADNEAFLNGSLPLSSLWDHAYYLVFPDETSKANATSPPSR